MGTLTIRISDDKHERLKALAKQRGDPTRGLTILDKLDEHFGTKLK